MSSKICQRARKSVIIVADDEDEDAYCSGCVIRKDMSHMTVTVLVPHAFVQGREERLKVVFFDKKELVATVVNVQDAFCSLTTSFHSACEKITLLQDGIVHPERTFVFVPTSSISNKKKSTYATVECLQSFKKDPTILTPNSASYFLVSCAYFEKTRDNINRLSAAPVFSMSGKTVGIILQDCRQEIPDPETRLVELNSGAGMKVALKATNLHDLMMLLDPPSPPRT